MMIITQDLSPRPADILLIGFTAILDPNFITGQAITKLQVNATQLEAAQIEFSRRIQDNFVVFLCNL